MLQPAKKTILVRIASYYLHATRGQLRTRQRPACEGWIVSDAQERNAPQAADARRRERIELVATVVLAFATVLTAWSAFESTKWSGTQSVHFARAGADRTESAKAASRANARPSSTSTRSSAGSARSPRNARAARP
jgi:hypothetical protein